MVFKKNTGFFSIPKRKEVASAIIDGVLCGVFCIAVIMLTNSLLSPVPFSEKAMRSHNARELGLASNASWLDIGEVVNKKSRATAKYSLGGANVPNLSMQSKHQHKAWPRLEELDRG